LTDAPRPTAVLAVTLGFEGGLMLLAILAGWALDLSPLAMVRMSWGAVGLGLAATVPLLLLPPWMVRSHWPPLVRLTRDVENLLIPWFGSLSVFSLALVALAAGLGEELLFRGVLQAQLALAWTGWAAVVTSSVLFGLVHLITPAYAALAALIGAYLGWLTLSSGNLLPSILVHTLYDFVALLYLLQRSRDSDSPVGGAGRA